MGFENPNMNASSAESQKKNEAKSTSAHEEETAELGSEKFFKFMLKQELEGVDSVEAAEEMVKEIVLVLEEDLGGDFEKEGIFIRSVEALPRASSVEEYIFAVAMVLEKGIHEKFTLAELEAVE